MRLFAAMSLVTLIGCGGSSGDIWLFSIDTMPTAECATEVTENYTNGTAASAPSGSFWIYSSDVVTSPQLAFGQFFTTAGGGAVLVIGDKSYPGEKVKGNWEFTYDSFAEGIESQEHAAGYLYEASGREGVTVTITADMKGSKMSGTWAEAQTLDMTYTESDEWDVSVGIISGQSPAPYYLLDSMGVGVSNDSNSDDCSGDTCSLQVVETCSASTTFTAVKVDAGEEDAFGGLEDAGQQPSLGE